MPSAAAMCRLWIETMLDVQQYLRIRMRKAFRRLQESLAGLDEAAAAEGADPQWRRYRFGTGLDGSIRGVVEHLAAWKQVAADGLESGAFPDAGSVDPPEPTW